MITTTGVTYINKVHTVIINGTHTQRRWHTMRTTDVSTYTNNIYTMVNIRTDGGE